MRFNRVEIILRDRKRRYKNSIRGKLKGVKKRNSIEIRENYGSGLYKYN